MNLWTRKCLGNNAIYMFIELLYCVNVYTNAINGVMSNMLGSNFRKTVFHAKVILYAQFHAKEELYIYQH